MRKDSERRKVLDLGLAFRCSMAHCICEGTKTFVDRPQEPYCTDCYDAIRTIRLKRMISQ